MGNGLNYIINKYKKNKYSNLNKLYNTIVIDNTDNYEKSSKSLTKFKCLLAIILLGNTRIVSVSFKLICELLIQSDQDMGLNRTDLLFKLGNNLFKFTKYIVNKFEKDNTLRKGDDVKKKKNLKKKKFY